MLRITDWMTHHDILNMKTMGFKPYHVTNSCDTLVITDLKTYIIENEENLFKQTDYEIWLTGATGFYFDEIEGVLVWARNEKEAELIGRVALFDRKIEYCNEIFNEQKQFEELDDFIICALDCEI